MSVAARVFFAFPQATLEIVAAFESQRSHADKEIAFLRSEVLTLNALLKDRDNALTSPTRRAAATASASGAAAASGAAGAAVAAASRQGMHRDDSLDSLSGGGDSDADAAGGAGAGFGRASGLHSHARAHSHLHAHGHAASPHAAAALEIEPAARTVVEAASAALLEAERRTRAIGERDAAEARASVSVCARVSRRGPPLHNSQASNSHHT